MSSETAGRLKKRTEQRKADGKIPANYGIKDRNRKGGTGTKAGKRRVNLPCLNLGLPTGEAVKCQSCKGNVSVNLFHCAVHGTCTLGKRLPGLGCCDTDCHERVPPQPEGERVEPPGRASD